MTAANESEQPDPRKVGQNPTGRPRKSSAGSRRLADKKKAAGQDRAS